MDEIKGQSELLDRVLKGMSEHVKSTGMKLEENDMLHVIDFFVSKLSDDTFIVWATKLIHSKCSMKSDVRS